MKKITSLKEFKSIKTDLSLSIGNFDGFHLGHQGLINNLVKFSREKNLQSCVITFKPHPALFIQGNSNFLITSYERRNLRLEEAGVDILFELDFCENLMKKQADEFIETYFVDHKKIKMFYLGYDFALGAGKKNAFELLQNKMTNIEIKREAKFILDNEICSSTQIRKLLQNGNIKQANKYLGRHFTLQGIVVSGLGIGSKELVPTANLSWSRDLIIPRDGVYFTRSYINGKTYESITNIGRSPTVVENGERRVETYLLDFTENIYSKDMDVEFLEFYRDEKRFSSKEELLSQISIDIDNRQKFQC